MRKCYEKGNITLFLGDCVDILNKATPESIDMIFADTIWSFLSEEFEKGNSLVTERIHRDYIKLQEKIDELIIKK